MADDRHTQQCQFGCHKSHWTETSTMATMAMVFAVLGVIGGCCTFGVFSIVSIILAHLAWKETKTGEKGGHGMTVASMVISYIMIIPAIFLTISFGISAATGVQ